MKGARTTVAQLVDLGAHDLLWHPAGSSHAPAYHSRYTLPDRKALDTSVIASFGRGAAAGDGRILVATQVAEQSLDVDFDLLVTDLCPVDVLLQRLGRVWRHRERDPARPPACKTVQAWVMEPSDGLEPLLQKQYGGLNGWGTVYEHLGFLELTRRTIAAQEEVGVPRDNRALIESVYHADPQHALRSESAGWAEHFGAQEGRTLAQEITAIGATLSFDDTYTGNAHRFDRDVTGAVRTRLGDDRVRVLLPESLPGCYDTAAMVDSVDLPFQDLVRAGIDVGDLQEPRASGGGRIGERVRFALQGFRFAYGPQGWEWGSALE